MSDLRLKVHDVAKEFVLHAQDGARLPVFRDVGFELSAGDCLALVGPSGVGKSSLMRMIYGNFRCAVGAIEVLHDGAWVDIASAHPHRVLDVRRTTVGYVSQFLRVIPRVPTMAVVSEPARAQGTDPDAAAARARACLTRLRIPESLWSLSPVTFSGGEQQRVNLARGFAADYPVMLLDEPTASLDADNRATVIEMIREARDAGVAIVGIFHDERTRDAVCNRTLDMAQFTSLAA